ncbi:amino acid adenylation domain-containing protein [Spirulina sp. CS-785/01]|uniref:non-ribosomal peptide synthetase family protein n=1 Tax=Spirulina sp. CS-785/01 TaxID=3021716 RepID=UPI00232E18A7|nr:amino acid adenylation domain-containing protein [Spirulina sp. CS-785/01]MDB9315792.1 amino acid adenylation domain-containing protein [Spirulina sp. CS-785/01]
MSVDPANLCIPQLIEAQVAQTPDSPAILYQHHPLTYQQLNEQANQLAHYLQSLGVKPDVLVGVCIDRTPDLIIALLAILKAGGAYVPLDPTYPAHRLSLMIEDAQPSLLLTQKHLLPQLPDSQAHVLCMDTDGDRFAQESRENPVSDVTPAHLAYVIYTSGSTGKPKGVAMPHRPLVNLIQWQEQQSNLPPQARTLQFTPISFDVSFQEIFSTLTTQGTLVLISEPTRHDPNHLLHFLEENQIARLFLPFVALRQLAEVGQDQQIFPPHLQEVITAGEQLRITHPMRDWFSQLPHCRLFNHYGPSETHVVTAYRLPDDPQDWAVLPPIGRPIANAQIYILNTRKQPVSQGIPGELYLGGVSLAQGYLNRPDLTAERFIVNPFTPQGGQKLYKTGDLARIRPDGNIEFLGRMDSQVKLHGFRIEPGEVEALLENHPKVREAMVMVREVSPQDQRLAAYVVPQRAATGRKVTLSAKELYRALGSELPAYMIPSAFIILDEFPLTPSGKVDRRAFPAPQWHRMDTEVYVAPRTPLEQQLAKIWTKVLKVEEIGINDRFADLGGNSLLAVQLLSQINHVFDVEFPLEEFLANPTIAASSLVITALQEGAALKAAHHHRDFPIELDDSIYPHSELNGPLPTVLLTGATGFLGAFLLQELLENTRADIYCLVRATNSREAWAKLQRQMQQYQLWNQEGHDEQRDRVIPIVGDLSQPQLALPDYQFHRLAEKIDLIYHCGAWVNVVYPYSALEAVNVYGTQEILRLASQTKIKPVHFISTIDVLAPSADQTLQTITETQSIGPLDALESGYGQTKYVAEQFLQIAYARGIPVSIYRPSNIMGASQSGRSDTGSFMATLIKGCIQMGMAPDMNALLNLIPVDYAAQTIVQLSHSQQPCGAAYYIVNPQSLPWQDFVQSLHNLGYPLPMVSYDRWYSQLLDIARSHLDDTLPTPDNPLISLVAHLKNYGTVQYLLGQFDFACDPLFQYLARQGLVCPPCNEALLKRYLQAFIDPGFLTRRLMSNSPS